MKTQNRISTVNLDYPDVKKVYDLYMKAQRAGKKTIAATYKQSVYAMQAISRFGAKLTFPTIMRSTFETVCDKFDDDCYVVTEEKLCKVIDAFAYKYNVQKNRSEA